LRHFVDFQTTLFPLSYPTFSLAVFEKQKYYSFLIRSPGYFYIKNTKSFAKANTLFILIQLKQEVKI